MIIRLERKFRRYGYTIGRLIIGDYSCDTLEDTVREGVAPPTGAWIETYSNDIA